MKRFKETTVNDVVKDLLLKRIRVEDQDEIKVLDVEQMSDTLHMTLGKWIRNRYGLWKDNKELLKDCKKIVVERYPDLNAEFERHWTFWSKLEDKSASRNNISYIMHPDDASTVILYELHRRLNRNK
jgi:hypothetical protein